MYHAVIPIYNGSFTVMGKERPGLPVIRDIPSFSFLISSEDGGLALVDTGFSPDYIPSLEAEWHQEQQHDILTAVETLGYNAGDITHIIQTHIHWDHTAGIRLFPDAEILVQAGELRALFELQPYEDTYYFYDSWFASLERMSPVHGSCSFKPGIELILTAGHSAGHQVVRVETRKGPVILSGDLPFNYDNLWQQIPAKYWQDLKDFKKQEHDLSLDVLPAVGKMLKSRGMWDLGSCANMSWRELKQSGALCVLAHDPGVPKATGKK